MATKRDLELERADRPLGPGEEERTETVAARVTPSEEEAINVVVAVRQPLGGVGALLRHWSLSLIIAEGRRLQDEARERFPGEEEPEKLEAVH